jgi:hypothetical protein
MKMARFGGLRHPIQGGKPRGRVAARYHKDGKTYGLKGSDGVGEALIFGILPLRKAQGQDDSKNAVHSKNGQRQRGGNNKDTRRRYCWR